MTYIIAAILTYTLLLLFTACVNKQITVGEVILFTLVSVVPVLGQLVLLIVVLIAYTDNKLNYPIWKK